MRADPAMSLLVRTPAPFPTESLFGFLLRVSESNGYEDWRYIAHIADVGRGLVQMPGFPIDKLARVLGRDVGELAPIAYRSATGGSGHFKILDHELGGSLKGALRLRTPAVCPKCVEEAGHITAFWDLNAAVACPKHGCEALRSCAACGSALRWLRPGLLTCTCGARLSGDSCRDLDDSTIELMRVVEVRLYRRSLSTLANTSGFPLDALEQIPLSSLLQILEILGTYNLWATGGCIPKGDSAVGAAAPCLEDWPHGYHRFLRRFGERSLAEKPLRVGLSKQFGPYYGMMFRNRSVAQHAGLFREEFIRFGLEQWGYAAVDKKLLRGRGKPAEKRFVSKSEFARRFGIWKPTMMRMIADGSVVTKIIRTGKSSRTVVDLHRSQLPVASAGVVTVRDAADYLGLPVSVLCELRDRDVFATQQRLGRESSWHKDDVETFLSRGLRLADTCTPAVMIVRLRDVMRLKLRDAAAKADVVAALFDRRLPIAGRVGTDLGGLQIDRKRLDEFILQKRVEVERNSYSLPEAAAQTGLDASAIRSAVELGILSVTDRDGRARVSAASIDAFNVQYVPVSVIAKRLGTLARVLVRLCGENDIPLIALSRANGSALQSILSRNSEAKLLAVWEARTAPRVRRGKADNTVVYEKFLTSYLNDIRATGGKLPRRGGKLNIVAIAKACGFCRHVLASFPSVSAILAAFEEAERFQAGSDTLDPVAALQKYLSMLRDTAALLPRSKRSRPNKLAIARACQFGRDVFYKNPEAVALLDAYAADEANRSEPELSALAA